MNLEHYDREVRRARAVMKGLLIQPYTFTIDSTETKIQLYYNSDTVARLKKWEWPYSIDSNGFLVFTKNNIRIVLT